MLASTAAPRVHCTADRYGARVCRTISRTDVATAPAIATTSTIGDPVRRASAPASSTEPSESHGETVFARHSITKVTIAITAVNPRALRVPKMPWMGPSEAMLPWMPRMSMGWSRKTPASSSRASESTSTMRATLASACTTSSVSRVFAIATPTSAIATIETAETRPA